MKKKKPLKEFVPDKFYLFGYGPLDKTIIQTKTARILLSFMMDLKTDNIKWSTQRDEIVNYWKICTKISRERKLQSFANAQGAKNDDNTKS